MEGAVEEAAVRAVHGEEIIEITGVGQVAAALPADENLLPGTVRLFQQENFGAHFRGPSGGHHPAGAGADDDHAVGFHSRLRRVADLYFVRAFG